MSTKIRTTIFLTAAQRDALELIRQQTGAAMSESIRRAIDSYIEQQQYPKPPPQRGK